MSVNEPTNGVGTPSRRGTVEIDRRVHHADGGEAHRLEHDGALVPGHRETIKEILEGRRNHRRARLARQNMAR